MRLRINNGDRAWIDWARNEIAGRPMKTPEPLPNFSRISAFGAVDKAMLQLGQDAQERGALDLAKVYIGSAIRIRGEHLRMLYQKETRHGRIR